MDNYCLLKIPRIAASRDPGEAWAWIGSTWKGVISHIGEGAYDFQGTTSGLGSWDARPQRS